MPRHDSPARFSCPFMPFDGCGFFLFLFSSISTYLISQSQLHWVCQTGLQKEWSEAREHVVSDLLGGWVLGAGTLFFLTSSLEVCI